MSRGLAWKKKILSAIGLCLLMVGLLGCSEGSSSELEEVKILLPAKGTAVYGAYVADQLGFFEEEGLDVEIVAGHGSTYVVQQVGSGTVDVGFSVASSILPAVEKGTDLKYVYAVNVKNLFDFIVPKDSDIQEIADLKGGIVGVSDLGGGEVPMVRSILEGAGLNPDEDVTLRAIGTEPASILSAFEQGKVDAYSSGANDLVYLYANGFEANSMVPEEYQYLPTTGMTVTGDTLEKNKALLVKVGRAMAKATLFSITNTEAAFKVMKEAIPEEYEDDKVGKMYLETYIDLTTPEDMEKGFGYIDKESWEVTQDLFLSGDNPVLSSPLDLDELLDESILAEVNDFNRQDIIDMANNY